MQNVAEYMQEFEKNSNNQYLPPFLGGYVDEAFLRGHSNTQVQLESSGAGRSGNRVGNTAVGRRTLSSRVMRPTSTDNTIWIAVSDYQLDRAYLVYRFFLDIGHIAEKRFTSTNLMYLRYFCNVDCDIALSYDGQRIGYGGDILVTVKPENPVFATRFVEPAEERTPQYSAIEGDASSQSSGCVIEMEATNQQNSSQDVEETVEPTVQDIQVVPAAKHTSYLAWLKQKISYLFYFY